VCSLGEEWVGRERRRVVGRQVEIATLADFLAAGRSTPQALVLDGVAGIGKTTIFGSRASLSSRAVRRRPRPPSRLLRSLTS
jgi:hypothetical protein